jgi:two-component system, OmpR family, copper resistance phosphate regulon response regulator CusR
MRILLVEDEASMAKVICRGLQAEHYEVARVSNGEDAFFLASTQKFDLVLLDLGLPKRSGMEVLQALRQKHSDVPVLIVTARDSVENRVQGLDAGADDYLVKPFAFPELLARIRALTRRGRSDQVLRLKVGELELDCVTRKVTRQGKEIALTTKEQELLEYLMRNRGNVVSREMLARDVWHVVARATPLDNVIDVHITHLRQKIDAAYPHKYLKTLRGVGFVLKEEA